ncbi:hypothetical protein Scep_000872 [Stephania cephalantha]|uniref:Uncharacterized protein n=1 Tax=Stephania cephalantha TaxID=152367 RepID=A0AAP0L737_9MAGN
MDANYQQVVVLPWFAFGHMLPFLEFSKRLATNGIHVHFVSSPKNIQRLPTIPDDLARLINLVQIPLPSVEGLPDNAEATIDLPLEQVQYLKKAYDGIQGSFEKVVGQILPDLVVCDFISCWVPETAAKFGIPSAFLSAFSAATLAFIGPPTELRSNSRVKEDDFQVVPDWIPFPSTVAYPSFQAKRICHNINIPDVTGKSSGERLAITLEGCSFILVRGCREFEGEYINLLHKLYQKPVIPLEILDHPAIGGCVFHSGWGSIIESLFYGHNLILLPMMADQGLNAKLMVEKGIGLEVERNVDGSFTRTAIARSIRLVMFEQEGSP